MKKKIITLVVITVIFALVIVTSCFIGLVNISTIKDAKETLAIYNECVVREDYKDSKLLSLYKFKDNLVRFTVINKEGEVIFDNEITKLDNHNNRQEIIDAFKNGSGSSVRYSASLSTSMVYVATKIDDNTVIRSSVPVNNIRVFTSVTLKYYIAIILLVFVLSLFLAVKLVKIIVYPINELQKVTSKIENGDLNKRAIIYNYDEIGFLAQTFNNIADQLEIRIIDSLDKKNKLEAILESMESGVIAIDNNENIILINSYSQKLFDLKEDNIGKKISDCIIDYDLINFIREIPEIGTKEIKLFHPIERELRVKKSPIINYLNNSIGIVITVQDITDIKRLENMRSEFVANVSHELKTPLAVVSSQVEMLEYMGDKIDRDYYFSSIHEELDKMSTMVGELLDFSMLDNQLDKMQTGIVNLSEMMEYLLMKYDAVFQKNSIKLEKKIEPDCLTLGNQMYLERAVNNYLMNAFQHTTQGQKIRVCVMKEKKKVRIEVYNDGNLIETDQLDLIWNSFYTFSRKKQDKNSDSELRNIGIGLFVVKKIIEKHKGSCGVNNLSEGVLFWMELPAYRKGEEKNEK